MTDSVTESRCASPTLETKSEIKPEYSHVQSVAEEFGQVKKKYTNDCGFDLKTLQRRDIELKELEKAYPGTCPSFLELAWNFCEYTPKEEQDAIIAEGRWEGPSKVARNLGGVIKDAISITGDEQPEQPAIEKLEILDSCPHV